ncbi:MAG: type II secretion system F family protein [Candidatus Micrarchaeota archaeon]
MQPHAYQKIASLYPRRLVTATSALMTQGGVEGVDARTFLGFVTFFAICAGVIAFFLVPFATADQTVRAVLPPGIAVAVAALFYLMLMLNVESRASQIEAMLPDALQIISANIRSGMTLENAIWSSALPEFGPLRDEIKRVSADTFGGAQMGDALIKMTRRVRSSILARSVKLINEGIRMGGEMAPLLEAVAVDIRNSQLLRKEIATSTLTYSMFIVFAGVIAAPLLFSVSTFYAEMNSDVMQKQLKSGSSSAKMPTAPQASGMSSLPGMKPGGKVDPNAITPTDVYWFSVASLLITTLFAGLIIGLIRNGKALAGVKYAPLFATVALAAYSIALATMRAAFAGLK